MNRNIFEIGEPITVANSCLYVERQVDKDALDHLRKMEYLTFIEPPKQGITSLIYNLKSKLISCNYEFIYADIAAIDPSDERKWYNTIGNRLLKQIRKLPYFDSIKLPEDSYTWRDIFLKELADKAKMENHRVVIALDGIIPMPLKWCEAFFTILRDIYNSRYTEPEFKYITFILAGAFRPEDFIYNERTSPFNVAHRLHLPDFTLKQVIRLLSKGYQTTEQKVELLANHVFYWTNGQPYLTQRLCSYLEKNSMPSAVEKAVKHLLREDDKHIIPMFTRLRKDTKLFDYIKRILDGERIHFVPTQHRSHSQLELFGIVKPNEQGNCIIRNRIYEEAIKNIECKQTEKREKVFICYSHKDSKFLESLKTMLAPYVRDKIIKIWDDTQIKPGSSWRTEIERAINSAKVAVLLVSSDFLASDFIVNDELPPLLNAGKKEGLIILCVPIRHSLWKETALKDYQWVIDPIKPIESLANKAAREKVLVYICERIKEAVNS